MVTTPPTPDDDNINGLHDDEEAIDLSMGPEGKIAQGGKKSLAIAAGVGATATALVAALSGTPDKDEVAGWSARAAAERANAGDQAALVVDAEGRTDADRGTEPTGPDPDSELTKKEMEELTQKLDKIDLVEGERPPEVQNVTPEMQAKADKFAAEMQAATGVTPELFYAELSAGPKLLIDTDATLAKMGVSDADIKRAGAVILGDPGFLEHLGQTVDSAILLATLAVVLIFGGGMVKIAEATFTGDLKEEVKERKAAFLKAQENVTEAKADLATAEDAFRGHFNQFPGAHASIQGDIEEKHLNEDISSDPSFLALSDPEKLKQSNARDGFVTAVRRARRKLVGARTKLKTATDQHKDKSWDSPKNLRTIILSVAVVLGTVGGLWVGSLLSDIKTGGGLATDSVGDTAKAVGDKLKEALNKNKKEKEAKKKALEDARKAMDEYQDGGLGNSPEDEGDDDYEEEEEDDERGRHDGEGEYEEYDDDEFQDDDEE